MVFYKNGSGPKVSDSGHPLICHPFGGIKCSSLHRHPFMLSLSLIQHDSKLGREIVLLCHICLNTLLSVFKCLMVLSLFVSMNCTSKQSRGSY